MKVLAAQDTDTLGHPFVVVAVEPHVIQDHTYREAQRVVAALSSAFGRVPMALAGRDAFGNEKYVSNRDDLLRALNGVPFDALPWGEYDVN